MTGNWLIVIGFILLVLGFALRTFMMMRASDAVSPEARVLHGRELLRHYRKVFPRSATPWLTRSMLTAGMVLLLAGLALEFSH